MEQKFGTEIEMDEILNVPKPLFKAETNVTDKTEPVESLDTVTKEHHDDTSFYESHEDEIQEEVSSDSFAEAIAEEMEPVKNVEDEPVEEYESESVETDNESTDITESTDINEPESDDSGIVDIIVNESEDKPEETSKKKRKKEKKERSAEDQIKRYKRRNRALILFILLLIIAAVSAVLLLPTFLPAIKEKLGLVSRPIDVKPTTTISTEMEDDDTPDVIYATLPGYSTTYYLNEEKPSVPLINLAENTINLIYELIYEDEVILTTEELTPGEGVDADLYHFFGSQGSYTIFINVYTKLPGGGDGDPMKFVTDLVIE